VPTGLYFLRKRERTGLFFVLLYLITILSFNFFLHDLVLVLGGNKFFSYRLFTIIEYFLITGFFLESVSIRKAKNVIKILSLLFLIFSIFDLVISKSDSFDSTPTGVSSILILLYSIYFFYEKIKNNENLFLYETPNFWVTVSFVVFFSGTFFIYIFSQNNLNDPEFLSTFAVINRAFSIVKAIFISIAFLIKPERPPPKKKPLPEL
jgi:hypothetical protein